MTIKIIQTAKPPPKRKVAEEDFDFSCRTIETFMISCAVLVDTYHGIKMLEIEANRVHPSEYTSNKKEEHELKKKIMGIGVRNLKRTFFRELATLQQHTRFTEWREVYDKYKERMGSQYEIKG